MKQQEKFDLFYKYLGWHCWSLGIHIDPLGPLIEIHIPTGWIRIGWANRDKGFKPESFEDGLFRIF